MLVMEDSAGQWSNCDWNLCAQELCHRSLFLCHLHLSMRVTLCTSKHINSRFGSTIKLCFFHSCSSGNDESAWIGHLYPFDGTLQGPCSWFGSHQVPQASQAKLMKKAPFHWPKGEQNIQLLDLSIKRSFDITQTSSQLCIYRYIWWNRYLPVLIGSRYVNTSSNGWL